jgi:hypothetical protein
MGNLAADETISKKKFAKMTESPIFTFSKPYLEFVSKGKLFNLIYIYVV